ncbi:MAG: CaiB/BaiF CoA transferase family protein [Pseudomonadota bacterium]
MSGPLTGFRVVDAGLLVAGPGAAGILCDWGAEVIKVEPLDGDNLRAWFPEPNPPFALDNRGKRSIAIDLRQPEGRDILFRILETTDAFVTNTRRGSLARLGIDYPQIKDRFPRLVYCHATGFGREGPAADRPAFDATAVWARAGIGATIKRGDQEVPQSRAAFGDHMTAMNAAGAVCAALLAREKTGEGQLVSVSLLRTGLYMLSWDIMVKLFTGRGAQSLSRRDLPNPLVGNFLTRDERWFCFMGNPRQRHDRDAILKAVGLDSLIGDPRIATSDAVHQHADELRDLLDEAIARRSLAEWTEIFDAAGIWWEPYQRIDDVVEDPFALANGAFVDCPSENGPVTMAATPADFAGTPWAPQGPPPRLGQHTTEILGELGYEQSAVQALLSRGIVGTDAVAEEETGNG